MTRQHIVEQDCLKTDTTNWQNGTNFPRDMTTFFFDSSDSTHFTEFASNPRVANACCLIAYSHSWL